MTDEEASDHVAKIYVALMQAEDHHPDSRALVVLHNTLADAFADFKAERPGVVQPFDGGPKPPPNPGP